MLISQKTYYKTVIEKQYANPATDMYTDLVGGYYKIKEERPLKWKVLQEKSVYEGYNVQKASTVLRDANGQHGLQMKYRFQTDLISFPDCRD